MSDQNNEIVPWVLTGIATVVGALSTALVYIFRKAEFDNAEAIKELKETHKELKNENKITNDKADKCEEDRHKLFTECAVMKGVLQANAAKMLAMETRISQIDRTGTQYQHRKEEQE